MGNLLIKTESEFSDRHMVSAGHHLAADAAREILDAGGNASDAGVCGGICLAVLLSEYVNFAGVAPIIYRDHETGDVITISGLGWWPQKASLEVIQRDYEFSANINTSRISQGSCPPRGSYLS